MNLRTIKEAPIKVGTKVIVRADFDVPVKNGKILNYFRIDKVIPSLRYIIKKGGLVRIISYLGRPNGKRVSRLSLKPVADYVQKTLRKKVIFCENPLDHSLLSRLNHDKNIILFENLRFWPEEEKNDLNFAKKLSHWGDIYINEAFANAHRKHAGVVALASLLPAFAGLQFEEEVEKLGALRNPRHPFVVLLGGIKLETKLPLVEKFLKEADSVLVGGAIANSFLHARGLETGTSFIEKVPNKIILKSSKLKLPLDVTTVIFPSSTYKKNTLVSSIKKGEVIVDIGEKSTKLFLSILTQSKTILWNGPLGQEPYSTKNTLTIAQALAHSSAYTIVGGGDTVALLHKYKIPYAYFTHVSTGGGAMLEFLAGKKLPGIEPLRKSKKINVV